MKNAPQPGASTLLELIVALAKGRYEIPDFQRRFVWEPSDIQELLKSIFRDYYIGNLLLWKALPQRFDEFSCNPIRGYPDDHGDREYIVLDGQQRLSAIYYAFMAPDIHAPRRKSRYLYFIDINRFQREDYEDAFPTQRSVRLLNNRQEQYQSHRFPVSILGEISELATWLDGYRDFWIKKESSSQNEGDAIIAQEAVQDAKDFGKHIWEIMGSYRISHITLDQHLEPDTVCDIFTKLNDTGTSLNIFDILNALLRPKGVMLSHLWNDAEEKFEFIKTERKNVYILQVMSLLKQGVCSPKQLYYLVPGTEHPNHGKLIPTVSDFDQQWNTAIEATLTTIDRLTQARDFGVISSKFIPYQSIIPALSALHKESTEGDPASWSSNSEKLRQWYWASVFSERYSGSVESTAAIDYREVCEWFEDDTLEPAAIRAFRTSIDELRLRERTRQGTAVYNGIINLLVRAEAKDWLKNETAIGKNVDDHHIIPKSWGKTVGLGNKIDTVLNRTLLSAETNRDIIGSSLPNKYLPRLIERNGESEVRKIFRSHFIADQAFDILMEDPFTVEHFEQFISARESTILDAIGELVNVDIKQDAQEE